jgi:hypothetical protein
MMHTKMIALMPQRTPITQEKVAKVVQIPPTQLQLG